jgi:hypothetical protein
MKRMGSSAGSFEDVSGASRRCRLIARGEVREWIVACVLAIEIGAVASTNTSIGLAPLK